MASGKNGIQLASLVINMKRLTSLKHKISGLLGDPQHFSLENRIFNGVNLVTVVLLAIIIIINCALELYGALVVLFSIFSIHCGLFYLSRYKRKFKLAIIGLAFIGYGGMTASFFNKAGVDGPAVFISFFISQLLIIVTAKRYHLFILLFSFCIVGVLFFLQDHYSGLITYIYKDRETRLIDYYFTFLMISIFSYLITRVLSDNYYIERQKSEWHTAYITEKHNDLQKATMEKERLFSLVFHDLRNPLSSIQFYLEQYADLGNNSVDDEAIREELLQLTRSTSSMLETMLLWVREQITVTATCGKETDIQDVILNAINTQLPFANKKNINLSYQIQDRLPAIADPVVILLLLRTLINNAIKFSDIGSAVIITAEMCHTECIVSVIDKGSGIKEEDQPKMFTTEMPSLYTESNEKGFGIGLVLAKQLADRQDIRLGFKSKYGAGSTFYFSINL